MKAKNIIFNILMLCLFFVDILKLQIFFPNQILYLGNCFTDYHWVLKGADTMCEIRGKSHVINLRKKHHGGNRKQNFYNSTKVNHSNNC